MNRLETSRGILLSVTASALFALMSAYTRLLGPLSGLDIFAWRIVWTIPGALALVAWRGRMPQLKALVGLALRQPRTGLTLVFCPSSMGV